MRRRAAVVERRRRIWATAAFLSLGAAFLMTLDVASDEVHLSTWYPAPSGVYTRMLTTSDTWLARDGGTVAVGTAGPLGPGARMAVLGGFLGVGTALPTSTLHVVGGLRYQDGQQALGKILTSDGQGNAVWAPPPVTALSAANFVTRQSAPVAGGSGYVQASCAAGEFMISGGCDAQDNCSSNDSSMFGGMPVGSMGWQCPLWHCNTTTAYVRCYHP